MSLSVEMSPAMLSLVSTGLLATCSSDSVRATSLFARSLAADELANDVMSRASPSAVDTVPVIYALGTRLFWSDPSASSENCWFIISSDSCVAVGTLPRIYAA